MTSLILVIYFPLWHLTLYPLIIFTGVNFLKRETLLFHNNGTPSQTKQLHKCA